MPDDSQAPATARRIELRRAFFIGLVANFTLHVLTGFIAVAVHYSMLYLLLQVSMPPLVASAIGFCGGAVTRFVLAYYRVFAPTQGLTAAGWRFVVVIGAGMLANTALLGALLGAGLSVWPAQIATTISLTLGNYIAYRLWVFR
jgi:putative flippase GtrA